MHFYLDGSGGRHTADPRVRRCGWSCVCTKGHGEGTNLDFAVLGTLEGWRQTVPRAELQAAVYAASITRGGLLLMTDCQYF
eukprot:1121389-Alexandrium_andersonii.AAC.1